MGLPWHISITRGKIKNKYLLSFVVVSPTLILFLKHNTATTTKKNRAKQKWQQHFREETKKNQTNEMVCNLYYAWAEGVQ